MAVTIEEIRARRRRVTIETPFGPMVVKKLSLAGLHDIRKFFDEDGKPKSDVQVEFGISLVADTVIDPVFSIEEATELAKEDGVDFAKLVTQVSEVVFPDAAAAKEAGKTFPSGGEPAGLPAGD